jgi:hypothetical protein
VLFVEEYLLSIWLGFVAQKSTPVSQAVTSVKIRGPGIKMLNE